MNYKEKIVLCCLVKVKALLKCLRWWRAALFPFVVRDMESWQKLQSAVKPGVPVVKRLIPGDLLMTLQC